MVDWTLRVDGIIETNVYDVQVVDSVSTFGDYAIAKIDDIGGGRFDIYNRGTRVELSVTPDTDNLTIQSENTVTTTSGSTDTYGDIRNAGTYTNSGTVQEIDDSQQEFEGYVVERREIDENGADALEIEAYTFDQFLRRNKVSNDQTGNNIAQALEDIITTDTPVDFVSANINVGDEQELTRSFRGVPVEQALQDLAFKSENEEFGVNDDLEFFFRPREITHIDRGIDNTQWFRYDIPELGKEVINEVEVWFNDGDNSVIVDDGADKLDLQENLGLSDPGTQRAEINRPQITDISDAEDEGRKYLSFRNETLSGTIATFDLFDSEPGDTIDVTIDSRGIDTEFRIAEVEYRWGEDETILTIVEKRGDNDDVLFRLTEDVDRIEMEDADRDAIKNRVTTTNTRGVILTETTVLEILEQEASTINSGDTFSVNSGETAESETWLNAGTYTNAGTVQEPGDEEKNTIVNSDRFVNTGRNLIRDVWRGESNEAITEIVVGDNNSGLSRSNDNLRNQTDSFSVTKTLPDSKTVKYSAEFTNTIQEFGLKTDTGRLVYRGVLDSDTEIEDIDISLSVSNDESINRGVVTTDGQTAIRDILADNSPTIPDEYGYGSGTTGVAESDTALANEIKRLDLENLEIQSASTTSDFSNITSIPSDRPLFVDNGALKLAQSCFFYEAEDEFFTSTLQFESTASDGAASIFNSTSQSESTSFTPEYFIAANNIDFAVRVRSPNNADVDINVNLDGSQATILTQPNWGTSYQWVVLGADNAGDLDASSHTLELDVISSDGDDVYIDCLAILDNRYTYNFDNTVGSNGYLDGPELYPELTEQAFSTATTRRKTKETTFASTWNDTSNNQFVELSNDGSAFSRVNNTDSGTVTFASAEFDIDTRIGLSRFGSRTTATPKQGFNGQQISDWSLFIDPEAIKTDAIGETLTRAIIPPNDGIVGDTLQEAGIFGNSTLLTRTRFAGFTVLSDIRISSSETTEFSGEE